MVRLCLSVRREKVSIYAHVTSLIIGRTRKKLRPWGARTHTFCVKLIKRCVKEKPHIPQLYLMIKDAKEEKTRT